MGQAKRYAIYFSVYGYIQVYDTGVGILLYLRDKIISTQFNGIRGARL